MNDDKLEMVVDRLREKAITAMCLYETWREGDHQLDLHGGAILLHGRRASASPSIRQGGRHGRKRDASLSTSGRE